jgi:tetratricopeptide (TPR) repeat protein
MPARHSTTNSSRSLGHLWAYGIENYHSGRHADCVRLLSEFEVEARGRGGSAKLAEARFWCGTALHAAGRLREAQSVLETAFASASARNSRGGFMALTRHLLVSAELPLPLTVFLDELAWVESQTEDSPYRGHRSRILHIQSGLELDRGNLEEARTLAEEGLEAGKSEKATFSRSAHRRNLASILLASGDPGEARRNLNEWAEEARREEDERHTRTVLNAARANLARYEGRPEVAVEWALLASLDAYQSEDYVCRISTGMAQVRALLATRQPQRARRPLADTLSMRCSEAGRDRYRVHLLHADFHLAMARSLAGLPILDLETGGCYVAGGCERGLVAADHHLAKAEQGYQRALVAGCRLDRLLSCNFREQEIRGRIAVASVTREVIS